MIPEPTRVLATPTSRNFHTEASRSFFLNKYFTFQNKERSAAQVLRFAVTVAVCAVLAYGLAKPAVRWALAGYGERIQENVAMLTGMVLYTGLNYLGQRFFAFRNRA